MLLIFFRAAMAIIGVALAFLTIATMRFAQARTAARAGDVTAADRFLDDAVPPFLIGSVGIGFAIALFLLGIFAGLQLTPAKELGFLLAPILLPGLLASSALHLAAHYREVARSIAANRVA